MSDEPAWRASEEQAPNLDLVKWIGPDDPENTRNWSLGKKIWTMLLIFLLTFPVYLGSSIYSPGIVGVTQDFGVSQVAATLGLSLFVAGYGLGTFVRHTVLFGSL
jgi:DHA1 family multidrug resistance protein-like MFS transporter